MPTTVTITPPTASIVVAAAVAQSIPRLSFMSISVLLRRFPPAPVAVSGRTFSKGRAIAKGRDPGKEGRA